MSQANPIPTTGEAVICGASMARPDGSGWNHCTLILQPGATDDEIALAVQTWQRGQSAALTALIDQTYGTTAAPLTIPTPPPALATEPQRRKIDRELAALGWTTERGLAYAQLHGAASWDALTKQQASALIDDLLAVKSGQQPTIGPPAPEQPAAPSPRVHVNADHDGGAHPAERAAARVLQAGPGSETTDDDSLPF